MAHHKLPRVALYTTRSCPNCRRAKAALKHWGIPFVELDIERNRRAAREYLQLRARAVPLVRIGDTVLQGYNARRLRTLLSEAGFALQRD